jgi:hypothetical protein
MQILVILTFIAKRIAGTSGPKFSLLGSRYNDLEDQYHIRLGYKYYEKYYKK